MAEHKTEDKYLGSKVISIKYQNFTQELKILHIKSVLHYIQGHIDYVGFESVGLGFLLHLYR